MTDKTVNMYLEIAYRNEMIRKISRHPRLNAK